MTVEAQSMALLVCLHAASNWDLLNNQVVQAARRHHEHAVPVIGICWGEDISRQGVYACYFFLDASVTRICSFALCVYRVNIA